MKKYGSGKEKSSGSGTSHSNAMSQQDKKTNDKSWASAMRTSS